MQNIRFLIFPILAGQRKGTDTQYYSWREHLVMALILYALFYVFLVLLNFFDSFKQESNKLELSQWKKGERGKF